MQFSLEAYGHIVCTHHSSAVVTSIEVEILSVGQTGVKNLDLLEIEYATQRERD